MPDGHGDQRRTCLDTFLTRRRQRPQESERLEVDPDQADARLAARAHVAIDEVAVGEDEQDLADARAFVVGRLREHLVVEHGFVDRDRQRFLRAEPDRVGELLRIVDAHDLERPDADPVRGDAEANAPLRQLVLGEELLERLGKRVRGRAARRRPRCRGRAACVPPADLGVPLFATVAADSCEAPIFRPTMRFAAFPPPRAGRLGSASERRGRGVFFSFFFSFFSTSGDGGWSAFCLRPSESSRR